MERLSRVFTHLFAGRGRLRAWFPDATLDRIAQDITAGELAHAGEVVFVVESRLSPSLAWAGITSRQRAEAVFAAQRVWDTEENTGVLVYVLLAEHKVEIVADRGIAARCPQAFWDELCAELVAAFRNGTPEPGVLAVLDRLHAKMRELYPADGSNRAELCDRPRVI